MYKSAHSSASATILDLETKRRVRAEARNAKESLIGIAGRLPQPTNTWSGALHSYGEKKDPRHAKLHKLSRGRWSISGFPY